MIYRCAPFSLSNLFVKINCKYLQVILCLKYWSREIDQPSKTQMLDELMIEYEKQSKKGFESRKCHLYIDDMVSFVSQ